MQVLALGKLTGGCGILKLQMEFQENTKLKGGDEYLARFWTTEATRLGMSVEQYAKQCVVATKSYTEYWALFEEAGGQ